MTPDHTPFLRPGVDLITAEDVLGWLQERVDPGWSRNAGRGEFSHALRARLDRERVQACRRAALAMWRSGSRHHRRWPHRCQHCRNRLLEALAFRAAAARGRTMMPICSDPPRETEAELRALCAHAAVGLENGHRFLLMFANLYYAPDDQAATLELIARLRKAGAP